MPSARFELRAATSADVPALRENWRLSFGDTDDYLDFFFSRRFEPENTLVACADGVVVSQLFLLPASLHAQKDTFSADYLFAAATHPDYRRQGIMASLIEYAKTLCAERGKDAIVLLPGTRELYDYYAQYGFVPAFYRRRQVLTRETLSGIAQPALETADASAVIRKITTGRDGVVWDAHALDYALAEHRAFRGACAASENAFVSLSEDEAFFLCDPDRFGECASLLLGLSDLSRFTVICPPDMPFGTREDGGMLCTLCAKPIQLRDAYLSFAME